MYHGFVEKRIVVILAEMAVRVSGVQRARKFVPLALSFNFKGRYLGLVLALCGNIEDPVLCWSAESNQTIRAVVSVLVMQG